MPRRHRGPHLSSSYAVPMLALLALAALAGCGGGAHRERARDDVWFVHATDPHIFLSTAHTLAGKDLSEEKAKAASDTGKQEHLDEKALVDMLQAIPSLAEGDQPSFLLFTGDLGVDPCPIAKSPAPTANLTVKDCISPEPAARKAQIEKTAALLEQSPLRDVYLVAGNNDIALEDSGDAALGYFNEFMDGVQAKIRDDRKDVQLHNLTRCYVTGGAAPSCYADIADTPYRLVGLPSYSFKQADADPEHSPQARQLSTFHELLDRARQDGKRVLAVSHIPEIDDPFQSAQSIYTASAPSSPNASGAAVSTSPGSIWKIKQIDDWKSLLAADSVAAVFAGHLHDSHRETYQQPYTWSTLPDHGASFRKLFLAPPLSVKNQDASPIQARGFSLVHLDGGRIAAVHYWYSAQTGHFAPNRPPERSKPNGHRRWTPAIRWLWALDSTDSVVERLAVLLIAVLAAFLTIVAVWQIPPPDTSLTAKTPADPKASSPPATPSSPFTTKMGMTVVGGLGGLVAAEVTKTLGSQAPSEDIKWYYTVWFILSFFLLMLLMNILRGLAEALRTRIAIVHYPLARSEHYTNDDKNKFRHEFAYWWWRFVNWFFSLRVPLLTFFDTFINLIQGKNQTYTAVITKEIIDQQRNVIRTVHAIRRDLNELIERLVVERYYEKQYEEQKERRNEEQNEKHDGQTTNMTITPLADLARVRVNISVLSADQNNVFYISHTAGSSRQLFPRRSMAWVCVYTGEIRWYKSSYSAKEKSGDKNGDTGTQKAAATPKPHGFHPRDVVLFDNHDGTVANDDPLIRLYTRYDARPGQDYQAFIMFPFPWPQRGFGTDYVKGAIHISFRKDKDFESIWKVPNPAPKHGEGPEDLFYPDPARMLEDWCDYPQVRTALRNSMAVLAELLHGFNETIYKSYVESQ